jgi:hypothetical protein
MATRAYVETHRALIQRDDLQRGLDYALLEYDRILIEQRNDANTAAAGFFKIMGAHEFIQCLKTLAESPRLPTIVPDGNLRHV